MKNILVIDANVILRYLLNDHPEHFEKASAIFEAVKDGQTHIYIPEGVLVECVYVLLKVYKVPKSQIVEALMGLLNYPGLINENRLTLLDSLRLFGDQNVDIVDAIVYTTANLNGWTVFSFDGDLVKLSKRTGSNLSR